MDLKKYLNIKKIFHTFIYYFESLVLFKIFIVKNRIKSRFIIKHKIHNKNVNRNETVNFRYLKKCINNLSVEDTKIYNFIDLGCGSGIALAYVKSKFSFNKLVGYEIYEDNYLHTFDYLMKNNIEVINKDVSDLILERHPTILYTFNSFGSETLEKFLSKNLVILKETNSKLIFINAKNMELINSYQLNFQVLDFGIYPIVIINF
tara:strand:- start:84 stop:698 length:615 start_codon:yes stop_codon:yes gene_type:complete